MSNPLPPPNPEEGAAAESEAAEARRTVLSAMANSELGLEDLFRLVDEEGPKHQIGHIHVRAALLALPYIGEAKSDEILEAMGLPHDRHIDVLGPDERFAIIELAAVEAHP